MPAANRGFHCSMSGRAWTDLVTNSTFLSGVELRHDLTRLASWGAFPRASLPAFLHESVHHWCFLSPVGTTLSLLQLRAFRRAVAIMTEESDGSDFDVLEDVIRYETAVAWLRPLAEGMALFAEFDATPFPYSSMFSLPMQWVYLFYTRPKEEELRQHVGYSLYKLLCDLRLSEEYIRHKASLLLQPLSCQAGGYLPGYLTMKQLWARAGARAPVFAECDTFLAFFQNYIYNDYGFVNVLLDDSVSEVDTCNAISGYLQRRLFSLQSVDLRTDADAFMNYIQGLRYTERPTEACRIQTTEQDHLSGKARLDAALNELHCDGPHTSLDDVLRSVHELTIAQRDLMRVGSADVMVRRPRDSWVEAWIDEDMLIDGAACQDREIGEGPGSLDIYVSLSGRFRVICVSRGSTIVLAHFIGEVDDVIRRQVQQYVADRNSEDRYNDAERSIANAFVEQSVSAPLLTHVRSELDNTTDQYYASFALLPISDDKVVDYSKKMVSDGIAALVGRDPAVIRSLALVSLCASLGFGSRATAEQLEKRGLDFDASCRVFAEIERQHGYPLLIAGDDGTLVSMV